MGLAFSWTHFTSKGSQGAHLVRKHCAEHQRTFFAVSFKPVSFLEAIASKTKGVKGVSQHQKMKLPNFGPA